MHPKFEILPHHWIGEFPICILSFLHYDFLKALSFKNTVAIFLQLIEESPNCMWRWPSKKVAKYLTTPGLSKSRIIQSPKYVAMALFENWGNKVLKSCNWWPIFGPLKVVQFNWEQIMLQAGCDFDISKFPIHRMREGLLFEALVSFENLECYFHSNPSSPIKNFSFVTFVLQQLFGRAVLIACSWTNIWNLLYKIS